MSDGSASPELDRWCASPAIRVAHRRESRASPDALWEAARQVRLSETGVLGRLVRWRIPGLAPGTTFDALFREPPFLVLEQGELTLVSGLVGRIWTLRRDYPQLASPDDFRAFSRRGNARVVFATWVRPTPSGGATIAVEVRVEPVGAQGRLGVAAVRPLVRGAQHLVGSEGIAAAVRRADRE